MRRPLLLVALIATVVVAAVAFGYWLRGPTAEVPGAPSGAPTIGRSGLPDPKLTPGAINPNVTEDTLAGTICTSGWTATVRPPSAYTGALKRAQIIEYDYTDRDPKHYQEDHLVPLELGGAPRDPRNLWPQPLIATLADGTLVGALEKDDLEDEYKRLVCEGSMDLGDAQRAMAGDWVAAWDAAGRP